MQTETNRRCVARLCTPACSAVAMLSFWQQPRATRRSRNRCRVDLVSIEDFSKLTKGAKDAPKAEEPKPLVEKKAETPKPVERAEAKGRREKEARGQDRAAPRPPPPRPSRSRIRSRRR